MLSTTSPITKWKRMRETVGILTAETALPLLISVVVLASLQNIYIDPINSGTGIADLPDEEDEAELFLVFVGEGC
jgi:hypothetical protein